MDWFLIFDTETTGLPLRDNAPLEELNNWPRMVQLAWQLHDATGKMVAAKNHIIFPEGFTIPYSAEKVHGISTKKATEEGKPMVEVLLDFATDLAKSRLIIGHNIDFDINIVAAEYLRSGVSNDFLQKKRLCTKVESTDFCALPGGKGGKFKWPNLRELYLKLFNDTFDQAHNASADVEATARCFFELLRLGVIREAGAGMSKDEYRAFLDANPVMVKPAGIKVIPHSTLNYEKSEIPGPENTASISVPSSENAAASTSGLTNEEPASESVIHHSDEIPFTHLHVHTQYSILDGAAAIPGSDEKSSSRRNESNCHYRSWEYVRSQGVS